MSDSRPSAKRPRCDVGPSADASAGSGSCGGGSGAGALAGTAVFVPTAGLAHGARVFNLWQRSVPALGGTINQDADCAGLTHILVPQPGSGWACLPASLQPGNAGTPPGLSYVTQQWLVDSLRQQQRQPEAQYLPDPPGGGSPQQAAAPPLQSPAARQPSASNAAFAAWLGPLWRPECASMDLPELMLQGDYDEQRCRRIGNEEVGGLVGWWAGGMGRVGRAPWRDEGQQAGCSDVRRVRGGLADAIDVPGRAGHSQRLPLLALPQLAPPPRASHHCPRCCCCCRPCRRCLQVVQALRQLQKFEVALNGANLKDPQGRSVTNHKASVMYCAAPAGPCNLDLQCCCWGAGHALWAVHAGSMLAACWARASRLTTALH
jgi:hypothetical protein